MGDPVDAHKAEVLLGTRDVWMNEWTKGRMEGCRPIYRPIDAICIKIYYSQGVYMTISGI